LFIGARIQGRIDAYMQRLRKHNPETVALIAYAGGISINLFIALGVLLAVVFLMLGH
jgi:hypothetical protein